MRSIRNAFDKVYWTGASYHAPQRCYEDNGYTILFSETPQPDDRANALAVLSGLADKSKYPAILELLKKQYNSSPYMEKYVLDAMFFMGCEKEALLRMKDRYQEMIDAEYTTLWETFIPFYDDFYGTRNHAWTGGPMVNLSGHVAGVAPDTAGYAQYHVLPQLGNLNRIAVSVPSVKGDIKVTINRNVEDKTISLSLDSPANTVARVGIPKFDGKTMAVSVNGSYQAEGVTFEGEDEKYLYFLAQPGCYEFNAQA